MLVRADVNNSSRPAAAIEPVTPAVSATDARQALYQRLLQIGIGKQVMSEVLSQLDNGHFLVRIDGTPARTAMPDGTRVGDKQPLVLVAREPRPTFLLASSPGSAPTSLSNTGRLIDHILQAAQQGGTAPATQAKIPLLPHAAAMDASRLADALHESVEFSGVFYESHVQQWASGTRALAELYREPQSSLPPLLTQQELATGPNSTSTGLPPMQQPTEHLPGLQAAVQGQLHAQANTDVDIIMTAQASALPAMEPEAAKLINIQLNVFEQQRIQWRGELWPGQKIQWDIEQDRKGEAGQDSKNKASAEPSWTSTVKFHLPALGDIAATIHLTGDRIRVDIDASDSATVDALRAKSAMLADALAAAGSTLEALLIRTDDQS